MGKSMKNGVSIQLSLYDMEQVVELSTQLNNLQTCRLADLPTCHSRGYSKAQLTSRHKLPEMIQRTLSVLEPGAVKTGQVAERECMWPDLIITRRL